ncbi:MAG: cysteine hydrolase [Candidatus Eremiobacteraeota bacterium]|nr:cysteine hydrolase [Candidatus Eremiobacteraeota bacterium]
MNTQAVTGLVVVDPYNDFISEGGKFWPHLREVAERVSCVPNMLRVLDAARRSGLQVFFAPHHRWRPGSYDGWKYWTPIQHDNDRLRAFEDGTWGGQFRDEFKPVAGEVVVQEHWCSSSFANTDLDLHLKKCGIHKLVVIGLIANTCIDSTVRFAAELGYEITLVKDATAAATWEAMTATLDVNLPHYATAIVTANELVNSLSVQIVS